MQNPEAQLNRFFKVAVKTKANDLHLKVGQPPKLRIQGVLKDTTGEVITNEKMEEMAFEILTEPQKETFLENGTLDFAYNMDEETRFRISLFRQRGFVSLAARRVSFEILTFEELNLPSVLAKVADSRHGLVLAVGPTGCGKTTTCASMVNYINRTRCCHVIAIEEPIEYLFKDWKAL